VLPLPPWGCGGFSDTIGRVVMTGQRPISVNESWEAMMFKRIDHVEIVTDQLTRTAQFYTEVLVLLSHKIRDRVFSLADNRKM
jgi:hypothetical protein